MCRRAEAVGNVETRDPGAPAVRASCPKGVAERPDHDQTVSHGRGGEIDGGPGPDAVDWGPTDLDSSTKGVTMGIPVSMTATVLVAPHRFELQERPVPVPGDEDVLVRVRACGI
jgi:hypothetical protein